jgi:hypothetical protein
MSQLRQTATFTKRLFYCTVAHCLVGSCCPWLRSAASQMSQWMRLYDKLVSPKIFTLISQLQKISTFSSIRLTMQKTINMSNAQRPSAYHNQHRTAMQRQTSSTTAIGIFDHYQARVRTSEINDMATMNDWLGEWATAPHDPLPSAPNLKPLVLLNTPAKINLRLHAQRTERVSLVHYDVGLIPEGRRLQDLKWEWERREMRLKEDAEKLVHQMERAEKREGVLCAAKNSEIIDLTGEETGGGSGLRKRPRPWCAATQQGSNAHLGVSGRSGHPVTAVPRQNATVLNGAAHGGRIAAMPALWEGATRYRPQLRPTRLRTYQSIAPLEASRCFTQPPLFQQTSFYDASNGVSSAPPGICRIQQQEFANLSPGVDSHQAYGYR